MVTGNDSPFIVSTHIEMSCDNISAFFGQKTRLHFPSKYCWHTIISVFIDVYCTKIL